MIKWLINKDSASYQSGQRARQQSGAILIVSLVILVLLTLLGITSMQTTIVQEKMASNFKNKSTSFQAAEAALLAGETWLASQPTGKPAIDSIHVFASNTIDATNKTWWWPKGLESDPSNKGTAVTLAGVDKNPRYAIEDGTTHPLNSEYYVFRIFSYALGGNDSAPTALESRYIKK